jgi:hypothetical protein
MGWWNSFKAALGIATRQSAPAQEVIDPAPMQSMPVIRHAQTDSPTIDLPAELRAQVAEHARSQQQLQAMLGTLANTMHAMPQIATQQAQVLETLLDQSVRARQRDQTIERNLTQLTEGTDADARAHPAATRSESRGQSSGGGQFEGCIGCGRYFRLIQ